MPFDDYTEAEKVAQQQVTKHSLSLIALLNRFEPEIDYADRDWRFYLQIGRRWILFGAKKYQETYYFFSSVFDNYALNPNTKELEDLKDAHTVQKWLPRIAASLKTVHTEVKRDSLAYHRRLAQTVSPQMRLGLMHRQFVRKLIPDWMRYDRELGARASAAMIELLSDYRRTEQLDAITAGKYFEYCKIAYLANSRHSIKGVDSTQSGRDLYVRWADGRDGGLRDLEPDSEKAFADWYHGRAWSGGHPFEIYRGGNTTHIDLCVERFAEKWQVVLSAYSSTRLAETCRIALAFQRAGMPFKLNHQESCLKRLQCDDLVGIIPEYDSVHRGWQRFPQEFGVADCVQFSWFRDDKKGWPIKPKQIAALITWLPQRPVKTGAG